MNSDRIKEILNRIPVGLILFAYFAYLGFDYYGFISNAESPLLVKQREIATANETKAKLTSKLQEASVFVKRLDAKKQELRKLALELQGMKESLSEKSDVPGFMKIVLTEARKLGVIVTGLKPSGSVDKEFYTESTFGMTYRGLYAQLVGFFDRLANVSDIVRVENIIIKPYGPPKGKFVMLEGSVDIKTYKYRGTNADDIGKKDPFDTSNKSKTPTPGASSTPAPTVPSKGAGT